MEYTRLNLVYLAVLHYVQKLLYLTHVPQKRNRIPPKLNSAILCHGPDEFYVLLVDGAPVGLEVERGEEGDADGLDGRVEVLGVVDRPSALRAEDGPEEVQDLGLEPLVREGDGLLGGHEQVLDDELPVVLLVDDVHHVDALLEDLEDLAQHAQLADLEDLHQQRQQRLQQLVRKSIFLA